MTDPWGEREPSAPLDTDLPLPPRLARLAEVAASGEALPVDPYAEPFPDPRELPEVARLTAAGWQPLHAAPLYCLLPAAWPRALRTWVPDRLPRVSIGGTTDRYFGTVAPRPDDDGPGDHVAEEARAAGLPAPPGGRIWLLRSPWPRIPVAAIYDIVWHHRDKGPDEIAQMYRTAVDVLVWNEARALAACPADTRDLLHTWAAVGRAGESASAMVEHGLRPDEVRDTLARTGLDEAGLIAWLDSLQSEPGDEAIEFIVAWRGAALPGAPPPGASRYVGRDLAELRAWIDAGFDLYAAGRLEPAGLATALRWRDAGFDPADTYELLRADPALTPDEAWTFDAAGSAREHRRDWIYYGFEATTAAAWAAAGLTPSQARIWRAVGKQPSDVGAGQRVPPELLADRRDAAYAATADGGLSHPGWDELADPPGTRGRYARRRARDPDPWINTD